MFRIVEKTELAAGIFRMRVEAPRVAASALPGQFVIVRADEQGERVPLTVADYDRTAGTVTIVTQTIGVSTRKICALEAGDALADFAGPLGRRFCFFSQYAVPPDLHRRDACRGGQPLHRHGRRFGRI